MPEQRTIILALVHYYLPGFKAGGPIRSISNLVERLGDEFDLRIIAADRDFREDTPYTDVVIEGWNQVGKAQVYYLSAGVGSLRSLLRLTRYRVKPGRSSPSWSSHLRWGFTLI